MKFRVDVRNALAKSGPRSSPSKGRESTATKSMGGNKTPSRTKHPSGGGKQTPTRSKRPSGGMESPSVGSKTTTNHLAKLTPKQIVIKDRQARDFFGRVIEVFTCQLDYNSPPHEIEEILLLLPVFRIREKILRIRIRSKSNIPDPDPA